MSNTETDTPHAYDGCYLEPMAERMVTDAQKYDNAAQSVNRRYYAYFRREAFARREMARDAVAITEQDMEDRSSAEPLFGEEATHGV